MPDNREEPAFPICHFQGDFHTGHTPGLTKREWFAGISLMGRRANSSRYQDLFTAADCFADADAILAASKEGGK